MKKHFTLADLLEQAGGLLSILTKFLVVVMIPFTFKGHELDLFEDHVEKFDIETCYTNLKYSYGKFY